MTNSTTNPPTTKKTMNCKLEFTLDDKHKPIYNPTEADIRAAMQTPVSDDIGGIFQIIPEETGETLQIELSGTKGHFSFDYCPNANPDGKDCIFSKRDNLSFEEALKVLVAFRNGSPDWKKLVEWRN